MATMVIDGFDEQVVYGDIECDTSIMNYCRTYAGEKGTIQYDCLMSCLSDAQRAEEFIFPAFLKGYLNVLKVNEIVCEKYISDWHSVVLSNYDVGFVVKGVFSSFVPQLPMGINTTHMPKEVFENLSVRTGDALHVLSGTGQHVVDYFVPKWDGKLVVVIGCGDRHIVSIAGKKTYYGRGSQRAFIGELVHNVIYSRIGYSARVIKYFDKSYNVKTTDILSNNFSAMSVNVNVDGVIVSVDGIEYKIKKCNTYELQYQNKKFYDGSGKRYDSPGMVKNMPTDGHIYECQLHRDRVVTYVERNDKIWAQTTAQINNIRMSPTFTTMLSLVSSLPAIVQKEDNYISPTSVVSLVLSSITCTEKTYVTPLILSAMMNASGFRAANVVKHFINEQKGATVDWRVYANGVRPVYAKPQDIINVLLADRVTLTCREAAYHIAYRGLIVSPKIIKQLAIDGHLSVNGNSVCVKKYVSVPCDLIPQEIDKSRVYGMACDYKNRGDTDMYALSMCYLGALETGMTHEAILHRMRETCGGIVGYATINYFGTLVGFRDKMMPEGYFVAKFANRANYFDVPQSFEEFVDEMEALCRSTCTVKAGELYGEAVFTALKAGVVRWLEVVPTSLDFMSSHSTLLDSSFQRL